MLKRICTYVWLGCSLRILFLGLIPQSHYHLHQLKFYVLFIQKKWNQWGWAFLHILISFPQLNSIRFSFNPWSLVSRIPSYHSELMCTRLISNYHRWKIIKEIYRWREGEGCIGEYVCRMVLHPPNNNNTIRGGETMLLLHSSLGFCSTFYTKLE